MMNFLEKLIKTTALFLPLKLRYSYKNSYYKMIAKQKFKNDIKYIKINQKKVLRKLREKIKKEKLVVAFYVFDDPKWKCQSLYDLMEKSEYFIPYIHATKNVAPKTDSSYQPVEIVHQTYNFFKDKGMRVLYNFDVENNSPIPTKNMEPRPDIVFYQHPWHIAEEQSPLVNSEFALTYYVPYFIATSVSDIEYALDFHQYIENHYILNEQIKSFFSPKMRNKGKNLRVVGHPQLDYFYLNKEKKYEEKNYVIYAPHWSIDETSSLKWGTFLWSGEFMLEFAKKHPEYNWVFKPHPGLIQMLRMNHWKEEKIQNYWSQWEQIGTVCEAGDYLDMFMQSKMMITDCGSFQTEYFMTQKPCVYLKAQGKIPLNPAVTSITDTYYNVNNIEELSQILERVLLANDDYKKDERSFVYNNLGYAGNFAAQNIMDDLLITLGVKKG